MEKASLQKFGLTEKEESVYLALLGSRDCGVNEIASKCGIHRQVAYDVLNRLLEKGLVSFTQSDTKKLFSAMHPKKLLEDLKENEALLENMLPQLVSQMNVPKGSANVSVIRGKNVVTSILKAVTERLEKKEAMEHLVMGVDDRKYMKYSPIYFKKFIKFLETNKLKEHVLAKEGDTYFAGGKTSQYKFIPNEFFNPTATHIAGNLVAIIIWTEPLTGILIESKETADAYIKYFNMLWKSAKTKKWRGRV